ncbi:MAG: hypothetical protein J5992_08565 [Oscillospiraceae bacterium]|nr:hypothetical protein [Oscillospiraceae bacterium]
MTDDILINKDYMNRVNKSVLSLKEKLTDILEEIKTQNNNFVSNSSGEFCNAFSQNAKMFEQNLEQHISVLINVNDYAEKTLKEQQELDKEIASKMG